jgi:hypothetical protein
MQKAQALFLLLLIGFSVMLSAQEDSEPSVEPDWENYASEIYVRGDQTFSISLGVGFPAAFINDGNKINHNIVPPVGGTGDLSYLYYLGPRLFVGGDLSLLFLPTIGKNTAYLTSLGAKFGTQFMIGRFEFPLSLTLGTSLQSYLDFGYVGFFMKGGICTFFRPIHDWSFGIMSNFCWFPQWTNEPRKNVDGLFVDLSIIARYHF